MDAGTGGTPSVTRLSPGVRALVWASNGAPPTSADATEQQGRQFGHPCGMAFTGGPVEELAREVAATLPGGLDRLYFLSSGSEAVEAALKLARQYWVDAGKPAKHEIIALAP